MLKNYRKALEWEAPDTQEVRAKGVWYENGMNE